MKHISEYMIVSDNALTHPGDIRTEVYTSAACTSNKNPDCDVFLFCQNTFPANVGNWGTKGQNKLFCVIQALCIRSWIQNSGPLDLS